MSAPAAGATAAAFATAVAKATSAVITSAAPPSSAEALGNAAAAPSSAESAAPPTSSAATPASPSASAAPGPAPTVKVKNIGMHIGGGPNDRATKKPIADAVAPHLGAIARCWAHVEEPMAGDFGVDLRIPKGGGKAKVSHPRTALRGKGFEECVVGVFETIEFLPPKGGTTVVSYSLRFEP